MKNDKHLEVIERATSRPIKSDKDYIYVFENGEQADDIDEHEGKIYEVLAQMIAEIDLRMP